MAVFTERIRRRPAEPPPQSPVGGGSAPTSEQTSQRPRTDREVFEYEGDRQGKGIR